MNVVRHKKIRLRKPWYRQKIFIKTLIIFGLSGFLAYLVLFSEAFRQEYLLIEGNQAVSESEIRAAVQPWLSQRLSSSLVWPMGDIGSRLKEKFPYIQEVKLQRRWPNTLLLQIDEREPFLCLTLGQDVFLTDQASIVLEEIADCPSGYTVLSILRQAPSVQLGQASVSEDIWSMVKEIKKTLSLFPSLDMSQIEIDNFRVTIIMVNPEIGHPDWRIFLNRSMEIQGQLRRLELFLQTRGNDDLSRLDYVDLGSHEERVFYANRQEN